MSKAADDSNTRRIVVALAFFVAAFAVRILSWPVVFRPSGVQPAGGDAFYHLRRIGYTIENFPASLARDPYLNFPHGGEVIWSPAFDWLLACMGRLFVGPGDTAAVESLMVWAPPLLGAVTVGLLYWIAARHFSAMSAGIAAALLCVMPAHVFYSRLAAIDHHVAAALCALWMLGAALWLLESQSDAAGPQASWPAALWLGVGMGSALAIWPGTLIHVAAFQLALAVWLLGVTDRAQAIACAWRIAALQAVAAAVVAPFACGREWEVWGAFSPVVLSNFQPVYLSLAACGFAALAILWQRVNHAATPAGRFVQVLPLLAIVAGLALAVLPSLGSAALDAWGWLSKDEEFQAVVAESAPLFSHGGELDFGRAELLLSRGLYVFPFALGWWVWSLRGKRAAPRAALIAWLAAVFLFATLMQRRFMNTFSLLEALVLAGACEALLTTMRARLPRAAALRIGAALAGVLIAVWLLLPIANWYGNDVANLARVARGEPVQEVGTELVQAALLPVAHWLRENTPETRGFFDAEVEPEYSLLSAWGDGHLLTYVARRPQLQGNFGDDVGAQNFALAEQYFSSIREQDAVRLLKQAGARYVVVSRTGSGHARGGYAANSLWARMYKPVREAASDRTSEGSHTLSLVSHRLIHTSSPPPPDIPRFPFFAVYERVEGAALIGGAPPGTHVEARLKLLTRERGELTFQTEVIADAAGRYRLQLPYANANSDTRSSVRVGQSYRISSADRSAAVVVREEEVASGAMLEGPNFGSAP